MAKKTHKIKKMVTGMPVKQTKPFIELTIMEDLEARFNHSYTPDYIDLKFNGDFHPVFVYGTLKSGNRLHDTLKGRPYLGRGRTTVPRYDLRTNGDFPIMMELPKDGDWKARVNGEVYAVDTKTMLDLDHIERNGVMYQRKQVFVTFLDQHYQYSGVPRNPAIKVWAYVGDKKFWEGHSIARCPYTVGKDTDQREFDWRQKEEPQSYSEYIQQQFQGMDMDDEIPFDRWGRGYD